MITEEQVLDLSREAIYNIIICGAPCLIVSLIGGLVISIFQTVTSIQEQTLTFVPKILAVFLTIMLTGSWMMKIMTDFLTEICTDFSVYLM